MKLAFKLNFDLHFNKIMVFLISIFFIFMIIVAFKYPNFPIGESDDYMISTITIQNHLSLEILPEDLMRVKTDFPTHYEHIFRQTFLTNNEGKIYPWYIGTYSIACIPIKILFDVLNIDQSYSFPVTNVIIYTLALLVVFLKLKESDFVKLIIIICLIASPIVLYFYWSSAEMFIASMVILTLIFWFNGEYCKSAIFISIAGSLNLAIMPIGIAIIISFFYKLFSEIKGRNKNIFSISILNYKQILKLFISFLPCLVNPIINYKNFGVITPQLLFDSFKDDYNWKARFFAYIFDLNFGIMPFYPIVLIVFFSIVIIGLINKKINAVFYFISFFGTIFAFSKMSHINSGMTGIARYNTWIVPIVIFCVCTQIPSLVDKCNLKWILFYKIYIFSLFFSIIFSMSYSLSWFINNRCSYVEFSPIAKFIMSYFPKYYEPLPSTFISRALHVDGGYFLPDKPVCYIDGNGYVKKFIITESMKLEYILSFFEGSISDLKKLEKKINLYETKQFTYLNVDDLRLRYSMEKHINYGYKYIETMLNENAIIIRKKIPYAIEKYLIKLEPNTYYKVSFSAFTSSEPQTFFVDLYADGYDDSAQEVSLILPFGESKQSLILNTNDSVPIQAYIRCVVISDSDITLENFIVEKVSKK